MNEHPTSNPVSIIIDDKLNRLRLNCGLDDDMAGYAKKLAEQLMTWPGATAVDAFPVHTPEGFAQREVIVSLYGPGKRVLDFRLSDDTDE